MRSAALNERLFSAAKLVRQDAVFADIGTDHAYLPIFLLKVGRVSRVFCSDINEGPLSKARENARENGLEQKITFTLSNGAQLLPRGVITDYAICGMGGELISDIISRSPDFLREDVRLILQPMTRSAHLRRFLLSSGFEIITESYSEDDGKIYVVFLARYSGISRNIDDAEAEIGAKNAEIVNKNLQISYLERRIRSIESVINGKNISGIDTSCEEHLLSKISEYIRGCLI